MQRQNPPLCRLVVLWFIACCLFAAGFCHANDESVEVVGVGECADCKESNFKISHAFAGLRVTIDCKTNGDLQTRGSGQLDAEGNFRVKLSKEIVEDGKLKEECYAKLHSAAAKACPTLNDVESSKIVLKSEKDGKQTLGLVGKIKFSPSTCASAFFWFFSHHPPLPTFSPIPGHPFFKPRPPSVPVYQEPVLPPPEPVYQEPVLPPPVPVYHEPVLPPPEPVYQEPVLPPPAPVYHEPVLPPPVPVYHEPVHPPPVPVYHEPVLPPPVPVYHEPVHPPPVPFYHKPSHPPIYKKPHYPPVYTKPPYVPTPVYKKKKKHGPKCKTPVYKHPGYKKKPTYSPPVVPVPVPAPVYEPPSPAPVYPYPPTTPIPKYKPKHPFFHHLPPHPVYGSFPPHPKYPPTPMV